MMGWPVSALDIYHPSVKAQTGFGSNQELQHSITARSFCFPTSLPRKSTDLCSTRWKTMETRVRSVEESFLGLGDSSAVKSTDCSFR